MTKRLSLAAILVVSAFAVSAYGAGAEDMDNIKRMDLNRRPRPLPTRLSQHRWPP